MCYCAVAAVFEVNLQFAALLAGYGIVGGLYGSQRERFSAPIDAISKVSFGVFVPIYFGIIGYRLVFGRQFSFASTRCLCSRSTASRESGTGILRVRPTRETR